MDKIRIITDSGSDIIDSKRDNVTVLPMSITFGDEVFYDGVTLSHSEFYMKLIESDELPKTSLIAPASFADAFEEAKNAGEKVIAITISGGLSGTYQSAVLAAEDYDDVYVVDSMNVTIGERILVEYALKLIDEGKDIEDIVNELESAKKRICVLGLLDTLEYLKKGGRVSSSVAFVGDVLRIKPVVTVDGEGKVAMLGKARGSKNGNNFLISEIEKVNGVDFDMPYFLGYTGLNDTLLKKYVKDSEHIWGPYTEELPVCSIGATIGTHVGPNAIAVAFFAPCK
ncbi:MAG: DegV family protein [Lachnospiraceae bacterium]|nr:DegV family protein [Lachnoclostridium sp.]MDD7521766.1 DegV family protein [Lachnoclostridium sp.]MDY2598690.1 DegV family protein [Lachnospiraceae bacterium]